MGQYGVSQAVTRREDQRLLTGRGCFTDDNHPAGAVFGYLLRAPVAHAKITRLQVSTAAATPGVLAIYTAADLAADGVQPIRHLSEPTPRRGTQVFAPDQPLLADETVRFVGEGLAFIVAESAAVARDAAEHIEFDYESLPAVTAPAAAVVDGAPQVWPQAASNLSFDWELGDSDAVDAVFANAAHIISLDEINNRVMLAALETRGAVAEPQPDDGVLLITGSQMPNGMHDQLREVLALNDDQLRVKVGDVGGGFGGKNSLSPEPALTVYAARRLQRPVRWLAERSEGFLSDYAGRDNATRGELAVDADGRFLALRVTTLANLGAYTASRGNISPLNVVMASNVYRIAAIHVGVKGVFSHTVPTDPYRGAGRPEILYLVERLVDVAATELGIDRIELRRRNLIPPEMFPYQSPTGLRYDPCDFGELLDAALERSDWSGFAQRRHASAKSGWRRGIGLASYVERCGGGGGQSETAALRGDADGTFTLSIGTMANGQGHDTAYSQILAERLGLPFEKIRIVQGDTGLIKSGLGTGGSWSIPTGGGAVCAVSDVLLEQAKQIAASELEAAAVDVEFRDGEFRIAGTDRAMTLSAVASAADSSETGALAAQARFVPDNYTFPYGCHVCEVEVDPDTGQVRLLSYIAVHDFGVALNPLLLAGQVHGGVAQGIGQALLEQVAYGDDGQLLSGSLMDYALPRADDLPVFVFDHRDTPCLSNPLGVKGCGEAGAAGSPPALVNAVVDALGVRHIDMPLTPQTVWRAAQDRSR